MTPDGPTIVEAGRRLREGKTTAVALLESVLDVAQLTEAIVHAYLTIDREGAFASAAFADEELANGRDRGPLHGVPVALKDNMCTRGVETTAASQILGGYLPPYDATVVTRLRQAGAVIVGKTNLDEFAMGSSTENSAYGPTFNPWDVSRVPGGSSGGSAAAVAIGSALGALGSDTGGSIRQPAALTGLVGLKPTYGTVSRYGLIAFASSLDQIGPLTRTVEDAAVLLEAVWGHDPLDATSYDGAYPDPRAEMGRGVDGIRVGVVRELSGEGYEPEVETATANMVDRLAGEGAEVVEVSLPSFEIALSAYYLIAPAEASANLARFDGIRFGLRIPGPTTEALMSATRAEGFGPEVTRRILLGTYGLSAGYYEAFYGQAQKVRAAIRADLARVYTDVDVLVSPTSPTVAFEAGARVADPLAMYLSDICTIPSNLAGDPAVSVPIALDGRGLPIGFQVMAPALGETTLFRVAAEVEHLAGFTARPVIDLVAS
ncbi:MAG: Asp-tRNA(Asn)/Glu-tRNA(Gln) amidotransferase subunit GatA [Actinobacteria bacterium]|nr:Asp-tRNA(Asn)/Glu-tRNA(Gln) amidotransferase subunit GatA [Actinomycetota bacterium]MCI0679047.1 Asp-tRNA(Asn)/Glu-tRNA(Gln) amidotransferase subunit GatA [Actinomycetota bacterium]